MRKRNDRHKLTAAILKPFVLAIALPLSIAACTGGCSRDGSGNGNGKGSENKPVNSIDLLEFKPAAPDKQVLTEDGKSPQIIVTNYNETATDALGRRLPTSDEVGLPKKDKYVGLFYSLWTSEISAPVDVTKALANNPARPDFGPKWGFCFWGEPETGYHKADDVWQIRRDMYYFAMAGVDFLYIDMTNGFLYENAMRTFLDTCLELRAEGQMTPYVVPWCFGTNVRTTHGDTGKFYDIFMTDEKYKNLWFYWEGKPLALIKPDDAGEFPILSDEEYRDKLTFRKSWLGGGEKWWIDGGVLYGQQYGWAEDPEKAECIGIGTAAFANYGSGRSGVKSGKKYLDKFLETKTMGEGLLFERTFKQLMDEHPECKVMLITRWNEWIAQNFTQDTPKPTDTGYADQFNREFSRDIEPMKGVFTDNYFYQMCSIIRRFKGVLPPDGNTGSRTVDIDGGFGQWQKIAPVFTDFKGDTTARNSTDTTGKIKYVNTTGRNDIVESRMTADGGMVYFYARTAEKLTKPEGRNWMLLFIDADNDKSTGWEGYDFVVNYDVLNEKYTTVCAYKNNVWQETGIVRMSVSESELMIAVPRSLLGITEERFTLNFHWTDNVTDIYDLYSWFTTGDNAPERRNNYTLTLEIPYAAGNELPAVSDAEITAAAPGRKAVSFMPAVEFTAEEEAELVRGMTAYGFKLTADYGKMPEIGLLEVKNRFKTVTDAVRPDCFSEMKKNYAMLYEGFIKLPADSEYKFSLTCDDCGKLYIDGRLIAECVYDENRSVEYLAYNEGAALLSEGLHRLRIEYAEVREEMPELSVNVEGGNIKGNINDVCNLYTSNGGK